MSAAHRTSGKTEEITKPKAILPVVYTGKHNQAESPLMDTRKTPASGLKLLQYLVRTRWIRGPLKRYP